MARLTTPILLLLLPVALFFAFFHAGTLDIGNAGWLIRGSDNGENALGAYAYWKDPTAGASLRTTLLNAPEGVPVLYTDSNPLLTLAVKPFASLLPADAQFVGPFVLLSLVLQTLLAWLLLRPHAPGRVALWAGVALLAFPPTLFNRFIHTNLMAHWTILAALCLYLDPKRGAGWRWWAPLIVVTALTHSYLLVMVGAIWASAMLVRFVEGSARTRLLTLAEGLAMLALVAALALWLGVGDQAATNFYGAFSMSLDSLWNPGISNFSNFLPAHERYPGQGFEGFQYMGLGGLVLVAAAVLVSRSKPAPLAERAVRQRLRGLAPALVVLAILAIARMPMPDGVTALLDPIRASGRLFWPVGYVLVFVAVMTTFRLSRERAGLLLLGIVALQVADLAGMASAVRAQTKEADRHRLYARTVDPRWDTLMAQARSVAFMPGDVTRDLVTFQEIAWRAAKARRPVANVYAARKSRATIHRLEDQRAAFDRGDLVPGRLYVLLTDIPLAPGAQARKRTLDGISVVVPEPAPPR